jgi:hypothetical protein
MKSLDQVEARTAITNGSSRVLISAPGSYYLTRNLTVASGDAIDIATNGVTLDLNGFTISSTASTHAGSGISLEMPNGNRDITIFNGHIVSGTTNNGNNVYGGPGFLYGIGYGTTQPQNVHVSNITASGCYYAAIQLGLDNASFADSCVVSTIGGNGFYADTVSHCTALDCGADAIYARMVSDSRGVCTTGSSYGIYGGKSVDNSTGQSKDYTGVFTAVANNCHCFSLNGDALYANVANNCYAQSVGSGTAISAPDGVATGCYAFSLSGIAISAKIANGCVVSHGTTSIINKYNMP